MEFVAPIMSAAHGGHGICRIDGQVCFVANALPGDVVRGRVDRTTRGVLWGVIEEVVESSPDRLAPCCPKFGTCGGCNWLHFAYPAQKAWKRRIVEDCLARLAGISAEVAWAEDPELRMGYRTRAEFHAQDRRLGFFAAGTHSVVDIESCPLCHDSLNTVLARLRSLPTREPVEIVANPEGPGVLLHAKRPSRALRAALPDLVCAHSFLFDGIPVVNGTFSQSSLLLNRVLVRTVRELAGDVENMLDLYCGSGNLSLSLAPRGRLLGLDLCRDAIDAANAVRPGAYRRGDEHAFRDALRLPWELVLLDPPRMGAKAIAQDLADCSANAIIYVSCDPATLARDLKTITAGGWRLARVVAVDLFPCTAHIETVCRLER